MASNGRINNDNPSLKNAPSYATAIDSGRMDDTRVHDGTNGEKPISIIKMFSFADRKDIALMIVGTVAAILHGTAQIIHILLQTRVLNRFIDLAQLACTTNDSACYEGPTAYNASIVTTSEEGISEEDANELLQQLSELALYYLPLAFGALTMSAIATSTWNLAGYRQALRIRRALFSSIVHQDLGWHDVTTTAQLTNRLSDDVEKIQSGLSDRVAIFIQFMSTFVSGFTVAFVFNWTLALVVMSILPVMIVLVAMLTRLVTRFTSKEQSAYARAGAVAEEVFSSIRTVVAFGGEQKEVQRYGGELGAALRVGIQRGAATGIFLGAIMGAFFSSYALAFWYGSILATECPVEDQLEPGDLYTVFICIIIGGFSIGQAAPELETFFAGRGSATVVYRIIDRIPTIDGRSPFGTRPKKIDPVVELRNVHFSYPSRPDIQVLKGLSITVWPGQTLALVGSSGCGKSTVVQLVQRFYDALGGQVLIGGYDVRELNIRWLRQHIGVVSQEPVLFATTIAENIRYGKEDATQDEIETAAKAANAHSFISNLPDGYNTLVGERGAQLSGGQKQRVAIARALVGDPKILLLDEATSALDTESEAQVQIALDRARQGRTTIVIAHRLSTVQSADMIAAIQHGRVAELGTHTQLMELKGIYHDLVTAQMIEIDEEASKEPLSQFRTALKYSQQRTSYTRQISSQSSRITPELADEIPLSLVRKQFSSMLSLDQNLEVDNDPIKVKEDWNPSCLDLLLGRIEQPEEQTKDKKLTSPSIGFWQLLALNKPEWHLVVTGVLAAGVVGATQPTLAIVFGRMLEIFGDCNEDVILEQTRETVPYFVLIGIVILVATAIQYITLGIASERLTLRLRWDTFKGFLRQDIAWFDKPENSTGILTTCLAVDTTYVKGATGISFGLVMQAVAGLSAALGIAFYSTWQLTLVIMGCVPFVFLTGFYQSRHIRGRSAINKRLLEGAGKMASQAIENIRTLHSLGIETSFDTQYSQQLKEPFKIGIYGSCVHGLVYGFSQCVPFLLYCVTFSFARYIVEEGLAEYQDIFRTLTAVVLTSMTIGRLSTYAPESSKARLAAARIFEIISREPTIDSHSDQGIKPDSNNATVDFSSVHFNYPTRPEMPVLQGMDLAVKPGQTLALVGPSGCGKSTVIQLLLRFYDPLEGRVALDGNDVKVLNVQWLRSQIGLVSQEPVLFNTTIADNIRYGANFQEVTNNEVEAAAKSANIHNFIMGLPQGYQTNVGSRGTQLSGGQKQRVAIARALVRDPKILLLDEATSALDTESEKVVQEALDDARQGRTSIVIAHRLSTIQNADCITVIHNGQVIESGTHKELMAQRGAYYLLSTTNTVQ